MPDSDTVKKIKLSHFLVGLAASLVAMGMGVVGFLGKFEPRGHAEQVHTQQAKQIEALTVKVAVFEQILPHIERLAELSLVNQSHIADRVGARQEPLIEFAPATQSTIKPTKGP